MTTSSEGPLFISITEAAAKLGVSVGTIRRWVRAGHIASLQPAGPQGLILIPAVEMDRLAGAVQQPATN